MSPFVTRLDKAIEFAAAAHSQQFRKATTIPYITHPFSVAMLLKDAGCDEDVVIAGLLHDIVEDTPFTLEDIADRFGDRVADIVRGCSEPDRKASWEERKGHTIEYLKTAPLDVKIVACADKLHNLRTIYSGYKKVGDRFWERFHRGFEEQVWYYNELAKSLVHGLDDKDRNSLFDQFERQVKLFTQLVAELSN